MRCEGRLEGIVGEDEINIVILEEWFFLDVRPSFFLDLGPNVVAGGIAGAVGRDGAVRTLREIRLGDVDHILGEGSLGSAILDAGGHDSF